ncbi:MULTISPECIES: HEPN domain-containing protein [unclassified Pseudomonas]|uniref:HEPN domain-containing protein n=1 Tax=unclassified Pseudomonas TaxID=196821 RepID=UPI00244705B1|nr:MULTISPECIES: HEPN domain-containing protein [unclassified Pseudomonas]MDG9922749.1 HEPN domain-containing protein [Pseudomonas sp. GD04045]MDH0036970.1 HEPN domain-containing protein [Pseudomonas sp. GD04019]
MKHEVILELGRIGRTWGYDLGWESICKADIEIWKSAEQLFNKKSYFHEDMEIKLSVDLSLITNWYEGFYQRGLSKESKYLDAWSGRLAFTVEFLGGDDSKKKNTHYARHFVEKFIYDIFIVMNLSLPGSCEFLNLIFDEDNYQLRGRLLLSSYNFENGHLAFLRGDSIAPKTISIEKTFQWYESLNLSVKQKSDSNLESAIFALLHICKSNMDVTSIVWMFHALEAIYKARVGENFTNLICRMAFLFGFNSKQENFLKKELRKIYDLRSSFVHGGYKIYHPMENEQLDPRVSEHRYKEYEACQVGFDLVVLSLQRLIEMGWVGIELREEILGISLNKE